MELLSDKQITLRSITKLEETINHFNDMGFMQSIDIITAIETVRIILKENEVKFNEKKVIGYGHSHGAYLLHLSNCLAPHLYSHIIDNSAWMKPVYLNGNRSLYQEIGQMTLEIEFDYIAKEFIDDKNALNLNVFYRNFENSAKIISFQGDDDHLIDYSEKEVLIKSIPHTEFVLVDKDHIDGEIFKSNKHGLDANFLKAFEYGLEKLGHHENSAEGKLVYEFLISNTKMKVDCSSGLPVFSREVLL